MKIETGIPKLDDFLGGGIPKGKSLIYYIQPGVEGEIFGMQTVYNTLRIILLEMVEAASL
ncbi:MAG: hypothetical protein O8C59_01305 [Candidatus Methanoperedens sp.]|nr:hypothetical protein [Candidatus Methanoperedens sp.]